MTRPRDPAELTESERFAEIAEILARGVLRLRVGQKKPSSNRENRLDVRANSEALCGSHALNPSHQEPAA